MNCPVCGLHEYDCECEPSEPIPEIGGEDDTEDALREHQEEQRKAEQARKDAGDERLLCAVLYEGKGEPN
jgi:hypothetical protein